MHSRLYLNVLNQNPNVESCMAFNTQYSDSGLFGMYITGYGQEAPRLVDIALNELHKLNSFTPEEVSRAK
ncbi:Mitochondrial-processing peptidase subunit alpha, variant 2, partial [Perkinsus olseni]